MATKLPANIGRFHPVDILGKGAQGVVYRAKDSDLGRDVAIKTLFRGSHDHKHLLNEARNVSKLQHPGIVPLYEIGNHEDRPYLVYQLAAGESLKSLIEKGQPLQASKAVELVSALLDAINYAHDQGIMHRDLTPANILLDKNNQPHILDFGVSGVIGTISSKADDVVGTVRYMAPELLSNGDISPKSDQFSLGVILHELLTGRPLFRANSSMAIIYKITNEKILPPSDFNKNIDKDLSEIVLKALSKAPADRYRDCSQMKTALQKYLQPEEEQTNDNGAAIGSALDFLLRRIRRNPDFPAVSEHISEITKKTSSVDDIDTHELSSVILNDYALSTKLLRLVNSATFSQYGGQISTISRAVIILGFEQVRMAALSIMLFEHLNNAEQADALKDAACSAFLSAVMAQRLASEYKLEPEQAFITSMFHLLGKHMTIYYFQEEYKEIDSLIQNKGIKENSAVRQALGVSYSDLGLAIANEWQLPDSISSGMRPPQKSKKYMNPTELTAQLAVCCNEIAAIAGKEGEMNISDLDDITERYKDTFKLGTEKLKKLVEESVPDLNDYADILQVNVRSSKFYQNLKPQEEEPEIEDNTASGSDATTKEQQQTETTETPATVHKADPMMLINAMTEISSTMLGDYQLNDIINMIMETIFRGMGFQRVIFCLRDVKNKIMLARFGLGNDVDNILPNFRYPVDGGKDLFNLIISKHRDFVIIDADSKKYQGQVPEWCKTLLNPHSMIVFPVIVNKVCIGLLYADTQDANTTFSVDTIKIFGSLRNQAALAIQQKRGKK